MTKWIKSCWWCMTPTEKLKLIGLGLALVPTIAYANVALETAKDSVGRATKTATSVIEALVGKDTSVIAKTSYSVVYEDCDGEKLRKEFVGCAKKLRRADWLNDAWVENNVLPKAFKGELGNSNTDRKYELCVDYSYEVACRSRLATESEIEARGM